MRLPSIESNNRVFTRGIAVLPALAGSAVSVMLIAASVWAVICIALRRYRVVYAREDRYVVIPALFYTLVMCASIVGHASSLDDLGFLVTPCFYLVPAILLPRYRVYPDDYFGIFLRAAPWCAILSMPLIAWQEFQGFGRVYGGAGNPFPYAMICAIFGPAALLDLADREGWRAVLPVVGFLASGLGVILSETRTAWLAFAINVAVLVWFFAGQRLAHNRRLIAAAVVAFIGILALTAAPVINRTESLVHDIVTAANGGAPGVSLAARLGMWHTALIALREQPLTGYGAQNRRSIVEEVNIRFGGKDPGKVRRETLHFSHFHNGFLTAGVDAGILGILATAGLLFSPLVLAVLSPRDERRRKRLAFALFFFVTYGVTGSFNIMFGQDLIDAVFIAGLVMVALSVPGPVRQAPLAGVA